MASLFYIAVQDTGEVYELSCTTSISVSETTKISSHKVENKQVISTNAVAYNKEISYNGVISNIRRVDQTTNFRDVSSYLEGLSKVRKDRSFVTCHIDDKINPIPDCLIKSLDYNKVSRDGMSSWTVSLKLQEVRTTEQAQRTRIPTPKTPDKTNGKQDKGNASTSEAPKVLSTTILEKGINSFIDNNVNLPDPSIPTTGG